MEVVSGNVIDAQMDLETLNDSFLIIRMDKTDAPAPTMTTPTKTTPTTTTPTATTPTTTTPTTTTTTTTTSTSTTASMCPRNDGKIKLNPSDASMSSSVAAHDTSKKADTSDRCIDGKTKKSHGSVSQTRRTLLGLLLTTDKKFLWEKLFLTTGVIIITYVRERKMSVTKEQLMLWFDCLMNYPLMEMKCSKAVS